MVSWVGDKGVSAVLSPFERRHPPLGRRPGHDILDLCFRLQHALLEQDEDGRVVKEAVPLPAEVDIEGVSLERDVDLPEVLWYEVLHFLVLVHDKAERRELAGSCRSRCQRGL